MQRPEADDSGPVLEGLTAPLDAADPRFVGPDADEAPPDRPRSLVPSAGPGSAESDSRAERILRAALPLVFLAGVTAVGAIFFLGLRPGPQTTTVGPEAAVRAAIAERPKRVCFRGNNPCAWLTLVDSDIVAFNTSGPLPQEYGRAGVSWCPSSGWFGANATGSRYDQRGRLARGPAPRGLDRFGVVIDGQGRVVVDWEQLVAGRRAGSVPEVSRPGGPHCETIPFDREADLFGPRAEHDGLELP